MYRYVSDISTDHILVINEREVVLDLILPANPEQLLSEEIRLFGYYSVTTEKTFQLCFLETLMLGVSRFFTAAAF